MFSLFKSREEVRKENQLKNLTALSNFKFVSSRQSRFERGVKTATVDDCWRGIQINKNGAGDNSYSLTIQSLGDQKSSWGDNIRMSIKQMKIGSMSRNKLELCGYGDDSMGVSFSDYGITVLLEKNRIVKIILKYFYRNSELHFSK